MRKRNVFEAYGLPSDEEFERFGREADAVMARAADCTRRHSGSDSASGVIYKTYETPPPRQQQINDLDPAVQARWDAWFDARFRKSLIDQFQERLMDQLEDGALLHGMLLEVLCMLRKEIDEVSVQARKEIDGLHAEIKTLQAVVRGEATPLVRRVTRDDAA